MYREQDAGALIVRVEAQTVELARVRAELVETQRELWQLRRLSRQKRAIGLGAFVGCIGALLGGSIDAWVAGSWLGLAGLAVGCGLGAILSLQGEIEPRPQDAPPARTYGGG
jgi:hypothetical protein